MNARFSRHFLPWPSWSIRQCNIRRSPFGDWRRGAISKSILDLRGRERDAPRPSRRALDVSRAMRAMLPPRKPDRRDGTLPDYARRRPCKTGASPSSIAFCGVSAVGCQRRIHPRWPSRRPRRRLRTSPRRERSPWGLRRRPRQSRPPRTWAPHRRTPRNRVGARLQGPDARHRKGSPGAERHASRCTTPGGRRAVRCSTVPWPAANRSRFP